MGSMKNKAAIATLLVMSLGAASAQAGPDDKPGTGPNPYVDCGIGAALFPDTHWAAVTSNVIWDLGTTAVTSATMSPNTCSGKNVKTALFIRDTYAELSEDAARGQGKHLTTALNLFECGAQQHAQATTEIRASMGQAVSQQAYEGKTHLEKSADFYGIINTAVKNNCVS